MAGHFFEVGSERDGRVEAGRYIVVSGNEKLPQISRWGKLLARQCCAYGLVQTAGTYLRPVGAHFSVICKKKRRKFRTSRRGVGGRGAARSRRTNSIG